MKHPTENFKKYPVLEELSTEKLNELLQQDFAASEETGPDVEFITAIMEVIAQRNALEATDEEAEASLRQFHAQAMPQETPSTEEPKPEAPSREPNVISFPSPRKAVKRPRRGLAVAAVVCVLVCLLVVPAQAGLLENLVRWNSETFSFFSDSSREADKLLSDAMYLQIEEAVAQITDQPVLPTWYPEGSSIIRVEENPAEDSNNITVDFFLEGKEFLLSITAYDTEENMGNRKYQKNDGPPEEYYVNGIPHYIMGNMDRNVAVWRNGTTECEISGFLSVDEIKQMIDSIYE